MAGLAVNVDHVALLRQTRKASYPDPVAAALLAELAGADAVAIHLREDRCHVQDRDVKVLRKTLQTRLFLEMAPTSEMIGIVLDTKPELVALVPERREELTEDEGLDLIVHGALVAEAVDTVKSAGISVGVRIDPNPDQVKIAHKINADVVQIHAGEFCSAAGTRKQQRAFSKIVDAVKIARKLKLGIHVGQGLCYNTAKMFRDLHETEEFIIGHSIVSMAALVGMEKAVKNMLAIVNPI